MIEIAVKNGIRKETYRARLKLGWCEKKTATKPVKYTGDYAVYRKGELLIIGTRKECAHELGVSEQYIHWMTTPTGKRRLAERANPERATTAVKLDDDWGELDEES